MHCANFEVALKNTVLFKYFYCFFIYLALYSLFALQIQFLNAKDFPARIYILVAERLPDGAGDVALNIRAAQLLQDSLDFAGTEVILLVPESAQESVDALLGSPSTLQQISLKNNLKLLAADFLFSFSQSQERSQLPADVLNAAKHHFIYKEHAENGFYIKYQYEQAPYSLRELEAQLLKLGLKEAKDLHLGRIALAYTFNKAPTEAYLWATARMAEQNPKEKFYLFIKDSFGLSKNSPHYPENLILISHPTLPLSVHESAIAHSHLPVLVTGTASINIALEYRKALFYETRLHTHLTWRQVMHALSPADIDESLRFDLYQRAFQSDGILSYLPKDRETVISTKKHPNLVDYFYNSFSDERVNRLFTTPKTKIRNKKSLLMRWLRHIRNAYNLESNPRVERVRANNQNVLEILALAESETLSLKTFIENTLYPALQENSILLPALLEDFMSALELTKIKKTIFSEDFSRLLISHLRILHKISTSSSNLDQIAVHSMWKNIIFQLLLKESGTTLLQKVIPLWKEIPSLRPNNRMIQEIDQIEGKEEIKAYLAWLKKEELERKLQGRSRLMQSFLMCKAWLSR